MKLSTMEDVFNHYHRSMPTGSYGVRTVARRLLLIPLVKEERPFDDRPCILTGDSENGYVITFKETGAELEFENAKSLIKYATHYVRYYNRFDECEIFI